MPRCTLEGHQDCVGPASFSPNGTLVLAPVRTTARRNSGARSPVSASALWRTPRSRLNRGAPPGVAAPPASFPGHLPSRLPAPCFPPAFTGMRTGEGGRRDAGVPQSPSPPLSPRPRTRLCPFPQHVPAASCLVCPLSVAKRPPPGGVGCAGGVGSSNDLSAEGAGSAGDEGVAGSVVYAGGAGGEGGAGGGDDAGGADRARVALLARWLA